MKRNRNSATKYSAIKQIYRENYLEDVSRRLREEAAEVKEDSS